MATRPSDLPLAHAAARPRPPAHAPGHAALPVASLRFALPRASAGSLVVVDAAGRIVRTILSPILPAGETQAGWDGRDDSGGALARGSYCLRLEVDGRMLTSRRVELR